MVIFCVSKFPQIAVFDNFIEILREYAVEAGDGGKCQIFLSKYFREWHRIHENHENLGPQNISATRYVIFIFL